MKTSVSKASSPEGARARHSSRFDVGSKPKTGWLTSNAPDGRRSDGVAPGDCQGLGGDRRTSGSFKDGTSRMMNNFANRICSWYVGDPEVHMSAWRAVRILMVFASFAVIVQSASVRPAAAVQGAAADPVDAATFALAFQQGRGEQFKGRVIRGVGLDFHGGMPFLIVTVGAVGSDQTPRVIKTWDEFVAAQNARTTLVLVLKAPSYQRTSWPRMGQPPAEVIFQGTFAGETMTVPRMGAQTMAPDSGPCPGENLGPGGFVGSGVPRTFQCVPVLNNVTVQ
jgi:hypothetical protein